MSDVGDDPVEITVTVKIPPRLVLEMQRANLAATIEGGVRTQEGLMRAWTDIWFRAGEQAQQSIMGLVSGNVKAIGNDKK